MACRPGSCCVLSPWQVEDSHGTIIAQRNGFIIPYRNQSKKNFQNVPPGFIRGLRGSGIMGSVGVWGLFPLSVLIARSSVFGCGIDGRAFLFAGVGTRFPLSPCLPICRTGTLWVRAGEPPHPRKKGTPLCAGGRACGREHTGTTRARTTGTQNTGALLCGRPHPRRHPEHRDGTDQRKRGCSRQVQWRQTTVRILGITHAPETGAGDAGRAAL